MKRNLDGQEGSEDRPRGAGQLDLHDGAFRRARFAGADEAARRHARPDGQAVGRDHRDADHLELQGRPSVLEYFNSTHGARKGLADTALKTANSGYLTRRLVDVAQDCIITTEDCGTKAGIKVRADHRRAAPSWPRSASASSAAPRPRTCKDPATGKVVVKKGTLLDEAEVEQITQADVQEVRIRSVLTCETDQRRLRQVLRARSGARHAGQYRRGGRRHRGAVDRRAGHPAHHAHLPHRRRGADRRAVVHRVRTSTARSRSRTSKQRRARIRTAI